MLKALKDQLEKMALDPHDRFTQIIRSRVGARMAPRYESGIRRLVLALPNMLRQIRVWVEESDHPWKVRRLQSFALAYLYNPEDFLPESGNGLFGYVDDAYIIGRVYEITMEEIPHAGFGTIEEEPHLKESITEGLKLSRNLIPDETNRMDYMLNSYIEGGQRHSAPVFDRK